MSQPSSEATLSAPPSRAAAAGQKLMFVVNPRAGGGAGALIKLIQREMDLAGVEFEIKPTDYAGHAEAIAREAARSGFDAVVAVGGDGTLNEVGRGLLGTSGTSLGILPAGSGNGVARHLGIPLSHRQALRRLARPTLKRIDVGHINGHPFFCTAGLGFDADVSRRFATSKQRGFATYARIAALEYRSYRAKPVDLDLNGRSLRSSCYVLAFANASQYGNNAYIAPGADVSDGLLDLCLIESLPLRRALRVAYGLAAGDLPKSRAARYDRATNVQVLAEEAMGFHVDGDYMGESRQFNVSVSPLAISVCV